MLGVKVDVEENDEVVETMDGIEVEALEKLPEPVGRTIIELDVCVVELTEVLVDCELDWSDELREEVEVVLKMVVRAGVARPLVEEFEGMIAVEVLTLKELVVEVKPRVTRDKGVDTIEVALYWLVVD